MEGVSAEASSFAGHLGLGKLIMVYDSNEITIEGSTSLTFTESVKERYMAYGWQVLEVDGHNIPDLQQKLAEARENTTQPTLIIARTRIAKGGAPTKEGTAASHGAPLGDEEIAGLKAGLGLPSEEKFYVPDDLKNLPELMKQRGEQSEADWNALFTKWSEQYPPIEETVGCGSRPGTARFERCTDYVCAGCENRQPGRERPSVKRYCQTSALLSGGLSRFIAFQ